MEGYKFQLKEDEIGDLGLRIWVYTEENFTNILGPLSNSKDLFYLVLDGEGKIFLDGKQYSLEKTYGIVIKKDTMFYACSTEGKKWKCCLIEIDKEKIKEYLKSIGFNKENIIFKFGNIKELDNIILKLKNTKSKTLIQKLVLKVKLYDLFSKLLENIVVVNSNDKVKENLYIEKAILYIKENYSENINVNDIIRYIGLNRSYFSTLFQKNIGISLHKYLTNFRLNIAKELILNSNEKIEIIAKNCGYLDPLLFSKTYKKMYGITPTQARKI